DSTVRGADEGAVSGQQLTPHHHALDLVRALIDLSDLRIAYHPLNGMVDDVSGPAEQLHGVRGDLHGRVRGIGLRRGTEVGQIVVEALTLRGGGVGQLARGLELHSHIGEHELDALVLSDGLAELLTLLDVVQGVVESALGDAHGLRRDRHTRVVEGAQSDLEPLARPSHDPVARQADVVKSSSRAGEPLMPSLRSFSPKVNPSSDFSTTKAEMFRPRGPSGSVTAMTV